MGGSNSLLELIESFLKNCFQRVVLNDQTSEWLPVKGDVPQGSTLGPLFFLIYINDLITDNLPSNCLRMIHHYFPLFMMLRLQRTN